MKVKPSKLHPVIKVKTFKEKKAQGELAKIQTARAEEHTALSALNEQKDHAMNAAGRSVKVRANEVQTSSAFIQHLSRQIQQQEKKIEGIKVQENEKRDELIQKSQARKMVEKLDEKRKATLAKEVERKEQRMLDVLTRRIGLVL